LLRQVASVNAFLAVFNLIPFYPLDGEKVNSWNPLLWASSFGVSAALLLA
jgi:Zn-dependent protease